MTNDEQNAKKIALLKKLLDLILTMPFKGNDQAIVKALNVLASLPEEALKADEESTLPGDIPLYEYLLALCTKAGCMRLRGKTEKDDLQAEALALIDALCKSKPSVLSLKLKLQRTNRKPPRPGDGVRVPV